MSQKDQWYYLHQGKSVGPYSKDQILELLLQSKITSSAEVWSPGDNNGWKQLKDVWALEDDMPPPLPHGFELASAQTDVKCAFNKSDSNGGPGPHPWRRYFARMIDTSICGLLSLFLLSSLVGDKFPRIFNPWLESLQLSDQVKTILEVSIITILALPANAALVGFIGTSLGKWLFGVWIFDERRRAIGFWSALKREFLVLYRGMGLGIAPLGVILMLLQNDRLKKNKVTSWDRDMQLHVVYRKSGLTQLVLGSLGLILYLALNLLLSSVGSKP